MWRYQIEHWWSPFEHSANLVCLNIMVLQKHQSAKVAKRIPDANILGRLSILSQVAVFVRLILLGPGDASSQFVSETLIRLSKPQNPRVSVKTEDGKDWISYDLIRWNTYQKERFLNPREI